MCSTLTDWNVIREDYLTSSLTYRELCKKYDVKYSELAATASAGGWHSEKKRREKTPLSREDRILRISDSLLDKIEKSITELDRCIVKSKEKTKTVEYDYETKKPVNEIVEEKEDIQIIEGMIDKMGLKQLVSTLKDIKDIHLSIAGEEQSGEESSGIIMLSEIIDGCDDMCDE